jgi:hypothetical protein
MTATLTITLEGVANLTATGNFSNPAERTWVEYDPRLAPWFETPWATLREFELAMGRAAVALNGRYSAAYAGQSLRPLRSREPAAREIRGL